MKKTTLLLTQILFTFFAHAQNEHTSSDSMVLNEKNFFHETNDNNHVETQFVFLFEPEKVKVENLLNGYFFHYNKPTSKWGVWSTFWIEVEPRWAQGLIGVMRRFHVKGGILELGIGTAIEHDNVPIRFSSFLAYEDKKEKFTILSAFEYGGSGHWYVLTTNYKINKFLGVGIHIQRSAASGPRINFHPTKRLTIWATGGIDLESPYGESHFEKIQTVVVTGVRYNFIEADLK